MKKTSKWRAVRKPVQVWLSPELFARATAASKADRRSRTNWIQVLIERELARAEAEAQKAA